MTHQDASKGPEPQEPKLRFNVSAYERRPHLTDPERAALVHRLEKPSARWDAPAHARLYELFRPVDGCLDAIECRSVLTRRAARWRLVVDVSRRQSTHWAWSQDEWSETLDRSNVRAKAYVGALAYLMGGLDGLRVLDRGLKATVLAERVFGEEPVAESLRRAETIVAGWGYDLKKPSISYLRKATSQALVVARSPHLRDLRIEHLKALYSWNTDNTRSAVGLLSRVLLSLGIVEETIGRYTNRPSLYSGRDSEGVPERWLRWCRRWLEHSTLRSRKAKYLLLLKVGRWLAVHHPDAVEPERWTAELATGFVAAVDRMKTCDWCSETWKEKNPAKAGKPLRPSAKANQLYALRTFFRDCHEWGWVPVRFNPDSCLRTPRSIRNLIGPDPQVIDGAVWARLVKAALELGEEDLHPGYPYPIEMARALAAIWVCSGLRSDEVVRLRVGCVRWQRRDAKVAETGEVLAKGGVCFLDVPVNKTSAAFTKPVPSLVGRRIAEWEGGRPKEQHAALDKTTGEMVRFLFSYRNRRLPTSHLNGSIIPMLCRKAGVPPRDERGEITSHRARATITSQLHNGPEGWTITELQAFLGHTDPRSTQYYAKADPTKLAKKFAESGYLENNLATVEVLLDVEALVEGGNEEVLYYELGHGLCSNPYWHRCPYRMACVKCPMYVPGEQAQYVRAKKGIRRMLETIPLTEDEKRAAEGDEEALNELLSNSAKVPVPANRQPSGQQIVPLAKKKEET